MMATWQIWSRVTTGMQTNALSSALYLGISSTFYTNVERLASALPPENAKPSLARVNIQSSPPVSPLRVRL
jgi:hypothetical protein